MNRIVEVIPMKDYCMEILLQDGSRIWVSFKHRLGTIRFGLLADEAFFQKATTDGTCISWEGKVELSLNEALQSRKQEGEW